MNKKTKVKNVVEGENEFYLMSSYHVINIKLLKSSLKHTASNSFNCEYIKGLIIFATLFEKAGTREVEEKLC